MLVKLSNAKWFDFGSNSIDVFVFLLMFLLAKDIYSSLFPKASLCCVSNHKANSFCSRVHIVQLMLCISTYL